MDSHPRSHSPQMHRECCDESCHTGKQDAGVTIYPSPCQAGTTLTWASCSIANGRILDSTWPVPRFHIDAMRTLIPYQLPCVCMIWWHQPAMPTMDLRRSGVPAVNPQIRSSHEAAARRCQEDSRSNEVLRRAQTPKHGAGHPQLLELWLHGQKLVGHLRANVLCERQLCVLRAVLACI